MLLGSASMRPAMMWLSLLLLGLIGCDRETESGRSRADGACDFQPESLNLGPRLSCEVPTARHHTLYLSVNADTPPADVKVSLVQQGLGGRGSTLDAAGSELMPLSIFGWIACEYRAGRRPWLEVQFCTLPNVAAGLDIQVRLADKTLRTDGHIVRGNELDPAANPVLSLRLVDGDRNDEPLDSVTYRERALFSDQSVAVRLFHVGGTRPFCDFGTRQAAAGGCEPDPLVRVLRVPAYHMTSTFPAATRNE